MFELNKKDGADTSTESSAGTSSESRQRRQPAQSGEIAVIGRSITAAPVPADALARVRAELEPSET